MRSVGAVAVAALQGTRVRNPRGKCVAVGLMSDAVLGMTCRWSVRVGAAEEEGRLTRRWVSDLRRLTGRASDPLARGLKGSGAARDCFWVGEFVSMYEQAGVVGVEAW